MSEVSCIVDSHDVKSKNASYKVSKKTVRSSVTPECRSNAGQSLVSATASAKLLRHSTPKDEEEAKNSSTMVASLNRKSRLQLAMNGKRQNHPEAGSLMQRRLCAKELRLASLQQHPSDGEEKEQREPSSCNGKSRTHQLSPTIAKAYPSSVSISRSTKVKVHSRSIRQSPVARNGTLSHHSQSRNMRAGTAAKQLNLASYYSNINTRQLLQQRTQDARQYEAQQHQPLEKNISSESSGQESQHKSSQAGPLSRFHKLKLKGMDHTRMAKKRKQAAQNNTKRKGQSVDNTRRLSTSTSPHHQDCSHNMHDHHIPPSQPQSNHDSPDTPLTDDDATLTSVARVVDQEQAFALLQGSASGGGALTHHQIAPHASSPDKPPRLWTGGEDCAERSAGHHQLSHHSGGVNSRPSSSSEFEPDGHGPSSQHASRSKSGEVTHSRHKRHSPCRQAQLHQQYFHGGHQHAAGASNYNRSQSPSHHQYLPPQAAVMMHQDRFESGGFLRRSGGSYPSNSGQQFYQSASNRLDDDDRTFDYGVKDDDSQGSTTFQQQLLEADRKAREQCHLSEGNTIAMSQQSDSVCRRQSRRNVPTSPLLETDDPMERYRQTLESPLMKTTCGVIGAATVGCIVIGPVGMLLGAAAVGIGVGVMQIPEEQRSNMVKKASETMAQVEQQAISASDALSMSCAATYKDSGIAGHIPAEMSRFCAVSEDDIEHVNPIAPNIKSEDSGAVRLDQAAGPCGGGVGGDNLPLLKHQESRKPSSPNHSRSLRSKKVACLRNVQIHPVSEIHSLEPAMQPRAWLDVLASADTCSDEKTEAMEEILILAKDKHRARVFLEEGILDSLMWILCRYFEKENRKPSDEWANPETTPEERKAATLAATCCVTLGKSHCAAIHTEGDLLLMSLYERGTVPEERQLAQMLYEVPHHTRVTKTNDPSVVDPSMEVFAIKQLTLPQAEEVAKAVKALADEK